MTVREFADYLGVTISVVHHWVERGIIPPPIGKTRNARYTMKHVSEYRAWLDLKHNNASVKQVVAHCRERGISLKDYVTQREAAIRAYGIGIA